nr:uncharacterized protein LOC129482503 [Symphalangus syndactylus]
MGGAGLLEGRWSILPSKEGHTESWFWCGLVSTVHPMLVGGSGRYEDCAWINDDFHTWIPWKVEQNEWKLYTVILFKLRSSTVLQRELETEVHLSFIDVGCTKGSVQA